MKLKKRKELNRKFLTPRRITVFVLVFLLLGSAYYLIKSIKLGSVSCEVSDGDCSANLQEKLKKLEGREFLKSRRAINNLLSNEPSVINYRVQYSPLTNLKVIVSESMPKYALTNLAGDYYELVDENGKVLGLTNSTGLPKLVVNNKVDVGSNVPEDYLFSLRLLSSLNKTYNIDVGKIEDGKFTIELKNQVKVVFPVEGDRQVLMGSLILIYNDINNSENSKLNTNGQIIDTIDLRFKNPVLKVRETS